MTRVHHLIQTNGLSNAALVFVACEQRVEMWQEHGAHTCAASQCIIPDDTMMMGYLTMGAWCFDIHGYV